MLYAADKQITLIADDLLRIAKGEVLSDDWSRQVYSVDASHYEVMPSIVVQPKDAHDVSKVCRYASEKKTSVTARGAGTGLLGQSLTDGIVMDFTKHMNRVIEIGDRYIIVEPGIVKAVLDKELKKHGKFLPVDPASSNYCTIGGMIANNSSGVHGLGYGNTVDFLQDANVVFADGATDGRPKFSRLHSLLESHAGFLEKYPKVSKNSCGYRLDAVQDGNAKVFAASEGTLGLVTSAKFRILDLPEYRSLVVFGFENLISAAAAVPRLLKFSPVALEMLDSSVFSKQEGCMIFAEFAGEKIQASMDGCIKSMTGKATVLESASDESSLTKIWAARKSALGSIMKMTVGSRKPIGLIEDTVVNPAVLSEHVENLLAVYREYKLDYVMYGHVGDGNLHTRPMIDTASKEQMDVMDRLARQVFARVVRSGGTITGEHGDGLGRLKFIEMVYGKQVTSLFKQVKEIFDPRYILNPGKKVPLAKK